MPTQERRTRDGEPARAAEPERPYLLRVLGDGRGLTLLADCAIGTAPDNTLVLDDPFVSKRHCLVHRREGGLWIQDRGSRNGTWVNSVRVERCQLRAGAQIALGHTRLSLVPDDERPSFGIVGESAAMRKVLAQLERLGPSSRPVLVVGETGTGKELVARALHERSPCRLGPYEPLNCGAIPRELAEAMLFGHAQGAFTGASRERRGAFERASGGTLFLDEIGEMPLELQPKLLRVLEEGVVQRLGEEQRRPVQVRLVAATHRDLQREADRGRFRLDLFHRIAVGLIRLPPLRERTEDIPLLVRHFLRGSSAVGAQEVEPAALALLSRQPWRGNVRELRNAVHRAVMVSDGGALVAGCFEVGAEQAPVETGGVRCLNRPFEETRRDVYLMNLRAHGGNRSAAAAALGIPKSTFCDHLREMGI